MAGGRTQRDDAYDFDRLEGAVELLLASHERLRDENVLLRKQIDERDAKLHELDGRVLEQNQLRLDALKRMDDLIARLDQLDGQFERADQQAREP